MKKLTFIILVSSIYLVGCTTKTTDNHGHDHGPNGEHLEEDAHGHDENHEHHEQEDFVIEQDSNAIKSVEGTNHKEQHAHDHVDHDHQH
jgi:hypothetical protein